MRKCWTPHAAAVTLSRDQCDQHTDPERRTPGFRRGGIRWHHPVSVAAPPYFSGQRVNDRVTGSLAFAAFAHEVAAKYPNITIALHTDHCAKQYLDEWVRPLLDHEAEQVKHGQEPTFQSHMWDGSTVPLGENLDIAEELLDKSQAAHTVLEIEIGAVGGEEDGHSAEINDKLYSTPAQGIAVAQRLGLGERGRYMAAFTFGNVHGAYKPGVVKLRPELLDESRPRSRSRLRPAKCPTPRTRWMSLPVSRSPWCSTVVPAPRRRRSRRP